MTKKQRRQIYWDVYFCLQPIDDLVDYKIPNINGICDILEEFTGVSCLIVHEYFPEFINQKPEDIGLYWWDNTKSGWRKRQAAILKAIELTYENR